MRKDMYIYAMIQIFVTSNFIFNILLYLPKMLGNKHLPNNFGLLV